VPECLETKDDPIKIVMLGASFDTGNMGVSALAESAIKCILRRWPNAHISLLGSGRRKNKYHLRIMNKNICIRTFPIRFSRNIFLKDHFVRLLFCALLFRIFRLEKIKQFCAKRNETLIEILGMHLAVDITGGDSFSDIYGIIPFVWGFLRKWLVLLFNKDLIMLPQTYGPFKRPLAKAMAMYILRHASLVYSRDMAGIEYVNKLLGNTNNTVNGKVRYAPDVAFVLDPREPQNDEINSLSKLQSDDTIVVGLNISGLLYNGGHTRNERFGLKTDYRQLVHQVARLLLENDRVKLLLVPHVVPPASVEIDDAVACLEVYKQLAREYQGRIFLVRGKYDQGEIKYVIGLCDFFVGSRMHSCIAALSQCVPAIGIAYSQKFFGVFESVGVEKCVMNAGNLNTAEILENVGAIFEERSTIKEHLKSSIPKVRAKVLRMFETHCLR